jgi:hypothetical protein
MSSTQRSKNKLKMFKGQNKGHCKLASKEEEEYKM